jgi:hypothetical protein
MELKDLDVEDVRRYFEDWYTGGSLARSDKFIDQSGYIYEYWETQTAWLAFLAGYNHCHVAAISAIQSYFESKWRK